MTQAVKLLAVRLAAPAADQLHSQLTVRPVDTRGRCQRPRRRPSPEDNDRDVLALLALPECQSMQRFLSRYISTSKILQFPLVGQQEWHLAHKKWAVVCW